MGPKTVLIVDDDAALRDNLEDILSEEGYTPVSAGSCAEALEKARELNPGAAILDIKLPDGSGTTLLADLKEVNPACMCAMVTAHADLDSALAALEQGAYQYLQKPIQPLELLNLLEKIFDTIQLREEKALLEAKLVQSQKMEAIGTVTGGIAHDFNNILGAIIGYTELAQIDIFKPDALNKHLEEILQASKRAKDLVKQILAFSRQDDQKAKPMYLAPILEECLKLLRASLPSTIDIRHEIAEDAGAILANSTQIHQVLMNLATNAAHAMAETGGNLTVTLERESVKSKRLFTFGELVPGHYNKLMVQDTGHGIDPETQIRIFDPYFTTKDKGLGTGLGLSVVLGIVTKTGGAIHVTSEPGKGTTFNVFFPIIDAESPEQKEVPISLPGGKECILLVDDEAPLVDIGQQLLEQLGYTVIARTSSVEALEAFREHSEKIDLVITDQTMPNMTGDVLARELMRIEPKLPVIIFSGFSDQVDRKKAKTLGIREFIMKPVVLRDLAQTVRRVLDSR